MKLKRAILIAVLVCAMVTMSSCDIIAGLLGDECQHEWAEATCTEPKICLLCDAVEGEALGHKGGTATCTSLAVCEVCGEEYGDPSSVGHTGEEVWFKHLNSHNKGYTCCGAPTTEEEAHVKVGGVCTICGYDPIINFGDAVISGNTATISVNVSDNPGMIGLELTLSFDESIVLTGAENGAAMAALAFTAPEDMSAGGTFLWDGIDMKDQDVKDGEILKLTFDISDATPGEHHILLKVKAYDSDLNSLSFKLSNGVIAVAE